ncbi:MAG: hypothetical protein SOY17_12625 [Evtepia sp.]|nr:hypothetical protein [Evtepia sp.]
MRHDKSSFVVYYTNEKIILNQGMERVYQTSSKIDVAMASFFGYSDRGAYYTPERREVQENWEKSRKILLRKQKLSR